MPVFARIKPRRISSEDKTGIPGSIQIGPGFFLDALHPDKITGDESRRKRMNKWIMCLIGMLIFLFPVSLLAEEDSQETDSGTALEDIVVTATRLGETVAEVNANVTVLDEEMIRMSPAEDLGDLLAEENIGHITKYPGNDTSIGIRSFRTSATGNDLQGKVLILLNGRRAGTGNVAKIMTENIERIEIIRGPASVEYGSAAIGGVVNVITKQGRGAPGFYVKGSLGSFGYEKAAAGFSGEVNGFDFSGSFSRSIMDDYDTGDGERYDNTGYDEKENISLNFGYEFLPNHRVGLIYTAFDADYAGSPYYLSQNDPDDYVDNSNESIDFIYTGEVRGGLFSWKARYFVGEDEYDWHDPEFGLESETETDHEGAQAQMTWNPGRYALTAGMDWINYEIEQDYAPNETEYDNPSYFLLGKAKYFQNRLIITGGLRYDDYEVDVKEGQGGTEDDDNLSPKLGASWFVLDNLKLRGSYSQGFRMPSASELAGNYGEFIPYRGNPNLDPEESDTYEVGVDWYHRALNASLTYFYNDFEDKIETVPGEEGVTTWENLGEATVSGFEGSLSCHLGRLLKWHWKIRPYFNFTYLTEYEDDETGDDLKYTSDLLLTYGLSVSDNNGFAARISFAYTGKQDVEDWENYDWMTMTEPQVIEKGGFTVASLTVEKRVLQFRDLGEISLNAAVRNIFDKDYAYVKGYPMPGRSFEIGTEYRF